MQKKLLIITQKVDDKDPVLGFFHNWIKRFAEHFEKVVVICLEKGEYNLPENVRILSLGKEEKKEEDISRIKYIKRFYKYITEEKYDSVFVHMNKEYILLGWWYWKFKGIRSALWYNHTFGDLLTRLAMLLTDTLFHTSPFAFTANTKKSIKMPAGIDTKIFSPDSIVGRIENSILYIGRIDPVKHADLLIKACDLLKKEDVKINVSIYGRASLGNEEYEKKIKQMVIDKDLKEEIKFYDPIPNSETPNVYKTHEILVNMTPKGNYDKTVLEALACNSLVVLSSEAFKDFIPAQFFFKESNAESFKDALKKTLNISISEREKTNQTLRQYVVDRESLDALVGKIKKNLK